MYSATDNPFHDVNLGQQFRWHKKAEKERKQGLTVAEAQRRDALRRQEAKEELERLNKRRADREAEQRLREQEEIKMQRLNESAQMSEWLAKDDDFQLDQERQRAIIRIKERRAKAVDFLALNLRYANPDSDEDNEFDLDAAGVEIDLDEPYNIFDVGFVLHQSQWLACLPYSRIYPRSRLTNSMVIFSTTWPWRNRNIALNFGRCVHSRIPPSARD